MDRAVVTGLVEDYWRTLLPAMATQGPAGAEEVSQRFEERIQQTAALMQPVEAAAFLQQVEAERERLLAEYNADHGALKQRLGIAIVAADVPPQSVRYSGGDMGGLAVRTVVRATIWQSIRELFWMLRR